MNKYWNPIMGFVVASATLVPVVVTDAGNCTIGHVFLAWLSGWIASSAFTELIDILRRKQ